MAIDVDNLVAGGAAVNIGGDLGSIKEGVTVTPEMEFLFSEGIEGLKAPGEAWLVKENYLIAFNLAEPTRDNIKIWLDSTNTESAGPDPITLDIGHGPSGDTGAVTKRAIAITAIVPGANLYVRTITFGQAVLDSPGEFKTTDAEMSMLPCTFRTLWDASNNRLLIVSDAQS